MGDRFYQQQKNHKPVRKRKTEYIEDVEKLLGKDVPTLDRMTIPGLEKLYVAILEKLQS